MLLSRVRDRHVLEECARTIAALSLVADLGGVSGKEEHAIACLHRLVHAVERCTCACMCVCV